MHDEQLHRQSEVGEKDIRANIELQHSRQNHTNFKTMPSISFRNNPQQIGTFILRAIQMNQLVDSRISLVMSSLSFLFFGEGERERINGF